jgi:hypothetical protein
MSDKSGTTIRTGNHFFIKQTPILQRQIILVLSRRILRNPQHDRGQHQPRILRHVRIPVVHESFFVQLNNVLQD